MRTVGIIAEYNPFHNGHAYQIAEAKRITGAEFAVVVMSGDFVQRGAPAVWDKYLRTRAALLGGADVVFELPVCFATASAEHFADGGVALLSALGVESICFGSECGEIDDIKQVAEILCHESPVFHDELDRSLRSGMSYPVAGVEALKAHCRAYGLSTSLPNLLSTPNNLLGVEYCKALLMRNYPMVPFTVKRVGGSHKDTVISESYSSASALRTIIERKSDEITRLNDDISQEQSQAWMQAMQKDSPKEFAQILLNLLKPRVPEPVGDIYRKALLGLPYLTENDFSALLYYRLLFETPESLSTYADWNLELANRMLARFNPEDTFELSAKALKSKQLTLTRASRMLLHVLLQLKEDTLQEARAQGSAFYARLLGIRSESSGILRFLVKNSSVPIINRLAPAVKKTEGLALELLNQDIRAAELYRLVQQTNVKKDLLMPSEYHRGVVRI